MSTNLCERCQFASCRQLENQRRDRDNLRNSIKTKFFNGIEVLSTSVETPSNPTALLIFNLPTVLKTLLISDRKADLLSAFLSIIQLHSLRSCVIGTSTVVAKLTIVSLNISAITFGEFIVSLSSKIKFRFVFTLHLPVISFSVSENF